MYHDSQNAQKSDNDKLKLDEQAIRASDETGNQISLSGNPQATIEAQRINTIKPSIKRYLVLFLFALNAGNKCFQWIQVGASTKKASQLYKVDNYVINTTSVIFLVICIGLSLPACYMIDRFGIRPAVLFASFGTAIGSLIKCFSCMEPEKEGIWLLMLGQVLVSLSEQLIFSLPSRLASVWFPDSQVSTAVSLCILGQSAGIAFGFVVPQWFLSGAESDDEINQGFYEMFLWTTGFSIVAYILDYFLFDEEPKYAPGEARLRQRQMEHEAAIQHKEKYQQHTSDKSMKTKEPSLRDNLRPFMQQLCSLLRNKQLICLTMSYGINVGTNYTSFTLLNQILAPIWPEQLDSVVGMMGLVIVLAGCLGSPFAGFVLDKWRCYKALSIYQNVGIFVAFAWLAFSLIWINSLMAAYSAACLIGFFQAGLIISGLEFAVELTYPKPELLTSSFMNIMPQVFGTIFIFIGSFVADNMGPLATIYFFLICTLVGFVLLICTRETLKRQAAIQLESQQRHGQLAFHTMDACGQV